MKFMVYKKRLGFGVNFNTYPGGTWGLNIDFWKWGLRTEFGKNKP